MNIIDMPLKLQICTINNKRDILDRKIKLNKLIFNFLIQKLLGYEDLTYMVR